MASIVELTKPEHVPVKRLNTGVARTPFGLVTLVWDDLGLRALGFNDWGGEGLDNGSQASFERDDEFASCLVNDALAGRSLSLPLVLCGTPFQREVWRALMTLHVGQTVSYGELALELGKPGAARAVGSAVGANRLGFVVPCHRVVRQDGKIGQFRWGSELKARLLAWESKATHG